MTLLRDFWYVAAQGSEITSTPLRRTILEVPTVFFRASDGSVTALLDICSHRGAPLSLGKVADDEIRCPYHGLRFDARGRCTHIPGQEKIPATAHVRAFSVHETHGIVWIWTGDADLADPATIPRTPWRDDPAWNSDTVYSYHVNASHLLMTDNLLDLGHVAFVHAETIGFDASRLENDPLVTEIEESRIRNTRVIPNVPPGPTVRGWGNFAGSVERTSISEWVPPCFTFINFINQDSTARVELRIDHLITPETQTTHHYWVMISRNFRIHDDDLTKQMYEDNDRVHHEDLEIVEATQRSITSRPAFREMAIRQDRGLIAAHRILDRLAVSKTPRVGTYA